MRWRWYVLGGLIGWLVFSSSVSSAGQPDHMPVPFLSQFDGSIFAATDCGPASVAMVINYATGTHLTPLQARQAIVQLPGAGYAANPASGTAIQDLAHLARAHGVETFVGDGPASVGWAPARLRQHLEQGHPVIVLTRLAYLPGYSPTSQIDHYIVLTGATPSGYVYNDPALANGLGRTISERQLHLAQQASSVPGQGAAFAGPQQRSVPEPATPTIKITVRPGDTLSHIAQRYSMEVQQIAELNRATLININHIEVGQVLALPLRPVAGGGHLSQVR